MKKTSMKWNGMGLLGVLVLSALAPVELCAAEEARAVPSVSKIAVVNLDKVFQEYERTKALDAKQESDSNAKKAEREKRVSDIKGLREELVLLNEESRVERQKAIEQKMQQLAASDQKVKETLRKQWDESVKGIFDEIQETVFSYAKEHGFDLLLSERAVLYKIEAIDITNEILKLLNERYAKRRP